MRLIPSIVFTLATVVAVESGSFADFKVVGDSIVTPVHHPHNPEIIEPSLVKGFKVGVKEPKPTSIEDSTGSEVEGGQGVTEAPVPEISGQVLVTSYPWLASIQRNKKQICTGTLINKEYVLTTAYCLFQLTPEELAELEVDIGYKAAPITSSRDLELVKGPYTTLKVKRTIRHLRFSPTTGYNDIGLLHLVNPVTADAVEPVDLETTNDLDMDTADHHLIGWRDSQDLNGDSIDLWRLQVTRGLSTEKCREGYGDILDPQGISPGMICSGGDIEATSCRWKFGTPLVHESNSTGIPKLKQFGMFSWGSEALLPECRFSPENPTAMIFTRMSSYQEWIQRNIKLL